MPRVLSLLLWPALLLALATPAVQAADAVVPAADFHLEDLRGKVVLMDFWASWCQPCAQSMPWLASLQKRYGSEGLTIVTVNLDRDWMRAVPMAETLPATIYRVHDPEGILAEERNLQGMPSAYLYDRDGKLQGFHVGFLENQLEEREREISDLLAGRALTGPDGATLAGGDGLQPWQWDLLAAAGMEIDPDPVATALDEHIYFSKEATSGGLGSAGGGCGCN